MSSASESANANCMKEGKNLCQLFWSILRSVSPRFKRMDCLLTLLPDSWSSGDLDWFFNEMETLPGDALDPEAMDDLVWSETVVLVAPPLPLVPFKAVTWGSDDEADVPTSLGTDFDTAILHLMLTGDDSFPFWCTSSSSRLGSFNGFRTSSSSSTSSIWSLTSTTTWWLLKDLCDDDSSSIFSTWWLFGRV